MNKDTSKHFPSTKGKQVASSSKIDLTGEEEESSQEVHKSLRIPPAGRRITNVVETTTPNYHQVFDAMSRKESGSNQRDKARPAPTPIRPTDPTTKLAEQHRAVNKSVASPFGVTFVNKLQNPDSTSKSKAPATKPYNYLAGRSSSAAGSSNTHTRFDQSTIPGTLQPDKAAALNSLKIAKNPAVPTPQDNDSNSDSEEMNITGGSNAVLRIKGAAESRRKTPKPKAAPPISGKDKAKAEAKPKPRSDIKGKGKAKSETEVETLTIADSDSDDPIQNDTADETESEFNNRTRRKSSSASNQESKDDPINMLPKNEISILGRSKQIASQYGSDGQVKQKVDDIEKKEKVATSMKGKQQPRLSTSKPQQNVADVGVSNDDDFVLPVSKPHPSPKSKSKSTNAPPPNAVTNWNIKRMHEFDIEPPLFTDNDGSGEYLATGGKFKMFISYGGPDSKGAKDHKFDIRRGDETVLSFRPYDLEKALRAEQKGLYTFTLKTASTPIWETIRKLTNYTKGTKPVLDLYIHIKLDQQVPDWLDQLIGSIMSASKVKYGKESNKGAEFMDERYAEVLGRLLINAKTTTTSRVVPTSKSTIQSNTSNDNRHSSPRNGTSSSKTGNGLIQTKIYLEPVRKSARKAVPSPELIPRAPIDTTPPDKVVLVWPFENFEGTGAVSITHADANRLQDAEYLNDTLIEYGLKKISDDLRKRDATLYAQVHVFNSFFYKKLSLRKSGESSFDSYSTVRKWTNKFKFFEKKYIVVPINEHMHWYLAIIVNPAAILKPSSNAIPRRATRASGAEADFPPPDLMDAEEAEEELKEARIHIAIDEDIKANPSQAGGMEVDEDVALQDLDMTAENSPEPEPMEGIEEEIISATSSEGDLEIEARLQPVASSSTFQLPIKLPVKATAFYASTQPPTKAASPPLPLEKSSPVIIMDSQEAGPSRAVLDDDEASVNLVNALSNGSVDDEKCYIYTFDSLGGTHVAVTKRLKEYLSKEAVDKLKKDPATELWLENVFAKTVKVPPQPNFCDCGLYLLHYVEQFFTDPSGMQSFIASKFTTAEMEQKWDKERVLVKRATVRAEIAEQREKWAAYRIPIEKKEAEEKAEKLRKKKAKEAEFSGVKLDAGDMDLDEDNSVAIIEKEQKKEMVLDVPKSKKRKVEEPTGAIVVSDDEEEGSSPPKPKSTSKKSNTATSIVFAGYDSDSTLPLDSDDKEIVEESEEEEEEEVGKGKGKAKEVIRDNEETSQYQVTKAITNDSTTLALTTSSLSSLLNADAKSIVSGSASHDFSDSKPQGSSIRVPTKRLDRTPPHNQILSLPTIEALESVDLTQDETSASPPKAKKKSKHIFSSVAATTTISIPTTTTTTSLAISKESVPTPVFQSRSSIDFAIAPNDTGDVSRVFEQPKSFSAGRSSKLQGVATIDSDDDDTIITVQTSALEFVNSHLTNGTSSSKKLKHNNAGSTSDKNGEAGVIFIE